MVGESVTITCSFDLDLTSIEWLYNSEVIVKTTASQLNLTFSPVNDTINNRQYTCRVITLYGMQEETLTVQVQGKDELHITDSPFIGLIYSVPPNPIGTSISTSGSSIAGYNFTLTCVVAIVEGLDMPSLLWKDSEGQPINSNEDIMIGDLVSSGQIMSQTLYFDPIRTSDERTYVCVAALFSHSLNILLNSSASYELEVQLSKISHD